MIEILFDGGGVCNLDALSGNEHQNNPLKIPILFVCQYCCYKYHFQAKLFSSSQIVTLRIEVSDFQLFYLTFNTHDYEPVDLD